MAALRYGSLLGVLCLATALAAAPGDDDPFRDDPLQPARPPAGAPLPPREASPSDRPGPTTTRPLAEVPVDLSRLEAWKSKRYRVTTEVPRKWYEKGILYVEVEAKVSGTIDLTTYVQGDQVVFRDTWWNLAGEVKPYQVDVVCGADSLLHTRRVVFNPRHRAAGTDLRRGRYDLAMPGDRRTGEWPQETLTLAALTRVVGLLPRDPGAGYTFAYFSPTPQLEVRENDEPIVCLGPAKLKVLNAWTECTKFGWGPIELWVRNCDGALARLDRPGYVSLLLVGDTNPYGPCCQPAAPLQPTPAAPATETPPLPPAETPPAAPAPPREAPPAPAPAAPDDPFGMP